MLEGKGMSNASFHDADPKVIVTSYIKPPKFNLKLPKVKLPNLKIPNTKSFRIIIFIIIFLAVIGLAIATAFLIKKQTDILTPPKTQRPLTYQEDLEQTMKQTFTNPQDEDILRYIHFASLDRTAESKFVDYSKAYKTIYQRYETSATVPIRKALLKLKAFLRVFPKYKDEDFKLLK